jgi:hypothetical protein
VQGNATTVASLFNGHLVSPSVSFRCRLESTIHIWNVVPVHKRYDLNYNFDNAASVSTEVRRSARGCGVCCCLRRLVCLGDGLKP